MRHLDTFEFCKEDDDILFIKSQVDDTLIYFSNIGYTNFKIHEISKFIIELYGEYTGLDGCDDDYDDDDLFD